MSTIERGWTCTRVSELHMILDKLALNLPIEPAVTVRLETEGRDRLIITLTGSAVEGKEIRNGAYDVSEV